MSSLAPLPRLAAIYMTSGHRIPDELLPPQETRADGTPDSHPLDGWECPLDATRRMGERAADTIRVRFPEP